MKEMIDALQRKLRLARQLFRRGNWSEFKRRLQRNLSPITEPLAELYRLGRDALITVYWRWRHRAGRVPYSVDTPFSLHPLSPVGEPRKNVIWIMLDALRQDIFEEYLKRGGLSDLAEEGAYFPHAFAQGSWTYPSVFSFLTGRYPFNCGVSRIVSEDDKLVSVCADFDDSCPTVFSVLRQRGYQVASILDGWGFTVRTTAGQEHREDRYFEENWGWIYGQGRRYLSLAELRDTTISYVDGAAQQDPFMLFVRSLYTHSPYRGIFSSPEYVTSLSRRGWQFRLVEGFIRGLQQFETIYLKPLLESLSEAGQLNNTILILCSDHGDMFWNVEDDLRKNRVNEDEEMWRHQLEPYNALIKVPLFIWGAHMHGNYNHRFRLVDVVPTLFQELGVEHDPVQWDGIPAHRIEPRPLYADSAGYGYGGVAFQHEGAKLLMSRRLGAASYNITDNEYERLALRQEAGDGTNEFLDFVQRTSRHADRAIEVGDNEEALLRRLEALGYL
jgi:arylsulfatase A-like enzyme